MLTRSKKKDSTMTQYYVVIGAFVGICVLAVLYVMLNPKKSFAQMPVIDDSAILVHNGGQTAFQRGENTFFQVGPFPSDSRLELDHVQREDPLRQLPRRQPQHRALQDQRLRPR